MFQRNLDDSMTFVCFILTKGFSNTVSQIDEFFLSKNKLITTVCTFQYVSKQFVYHPATVKISNEIKAGLQHLLREKLFSDDTAKKCSKMLNVVF